ncbi:leucine-rich repeat domain-containing protein [Bacteroides sp. Ga6A1]|uniref:leucine-rich repeat domain-containing protein n=1 Tax=Bacteroides sp. Ga6A1 TaxID=1410607 RepID=UPI0009DDA6F0|nr:leucine-rich repeat domain-containing protein [Bacteroides sp. Ga6A1]
MKKFLLTIILSIVSFNMIHADVTWKLSNDGTLTISGTNMPDYYSSKGSNAPWLSQKDKIKKVVINNGVTNIGSGAFYECKNLTTVIIGNSVKSIGRCAFYYCKSLPSPTIPNSVTSIGDYAFSQCLSINYITIPNSVTSIGNGAFNGSALRTVTIPNSVTSLGEGVFGFCYGLTSVSIPNSVKTIGEKTFEYCSSLKSVTIPNSVTSIGSYAFWKCIELTSVTIPNSVTNIEGYAFFECKKLTSVTIPKSVTSIGNSVFKNCDALTSVTNLAKTPQKIGDKTFTKYGTLHVLPGCKATYEAADYWKNFTILEDAVDTLSGTTGVADIEADNGMKDGKYIIDGKVVIVRNGKKYNLNGIAE